MKFVICLYLFFVKIYLILLKKKRKILTNNFKNYFFKKYYLKIRYNIIDKSII